MTNTLKPLPEEFFASLLKLMIYPASPEPKGDLQKSLRIKRFLRGLVHSGNEWRAQPGAETINSTAGFGSYDDKQIFDEIQIAKFRGLQIGALLYGLYWMSRLPDDRSYANKKFAAKLVAAPPSFEVTQRSAKILKYVDEFAPVAHYWAAFLLVVYPLNYSGLTEERGKYEEGTQDSLWDFIETVDMPTFFGHANEFRTFLGKYTHPQTKMRQAFSVDEKYHWLPPPPSIETITEAIIIPNIWSATYPFAKIKKDFDKQRAEKLKTGKANYAKNLSSIKKNCQVM